MSEKPAFNFQQPVSIKVERTIDAATRENVLPNRFVGELKPGTLAPSVRNVEKWIATNTAPQDINDFRDGQNGQTIVVLGEGFSTVIHAARIQTNTAMDKLLDAGRVYVFTRFDDVWYEHG